ncbi:MAG: helix-turn-helix transcriptional regulator [Myxococcales bacterium]|nr:helix-turn-helix transcriptional regulator [Myxococcales bacterium]
MTRLHGSLAPGVDFLRIRKTTQLYRGMKAHYGVSFTLDGSASSTIDGDSYTQTPGTLNLKQPGQLHRDLHRESPGTYQLVSFDAALIEASRLAMDHGLHGRLADVQVHPRDDRLAPLRRLHDVILAGAADRFVVDVAVTEAVATFTSFLTASPRSPRLRPSVRRAREFLLANLAEKITLDDLADHARTDKYHLCRAFSRELGMPPYAFLTRARIARACILLRRGAAASDVAPRVGFCDQSQLHRHFVRVVGCTPGAYRGVPERAI